MGLDAVEAPGVAVLRTCEGVVAVHMVHNPQAVMPQRPGVADSRQHFLSSRSLL